MLSRLLAVCFALIGFSAAFTENDWRSAVIEVYSKFTKYLNERTFGRELRELFTDDPEELWPRMSVVRKEGVLPATNGLSDRYPAEYLYIAFVELLFSSSEVSIVRTIQHIELVGGRKIMHNGFDMFVRNKDGVKVKLSIFNNT